MITRFVIVFRWFTKETGLTTLDPTKVRVVHLAATRLPQSALPTIAYPPLKRFPLLSPALALWSTLVMAQNAWFLSVKRSSKPSNVRGGLLPEN
jgi:hypothetical protein